MVGIEKYFRKNQYDTMKQLVIIIIFLVFLGILIGANIYLARRFTGYFGFESARWLYIGFISATLFMIGGVMGFSNSLSLTGHIVYGIAAITMGFMLFLLFSTLLVEPLHLFMKFKPVVYGFLAVGLAAIISMIGLWNATNLRISQIEIPVKGLTKEIRAMHLSDIHLGHFRGKGYLQQIVDKTNNQKPDVVFLTGDLFDGRIRLNEKSLEPLKQLNMPVFFVEGNHDIYTGVEMVKHLLRKNNVRVLENEVTGWGELQIIGLNHMLADNSAVDMHSSGNRETIQSVLELLETENNKPTVLLHHSPDGIKYASDKNVDLYLAGHTHAGQLFPINYITELLFAYNRGLHDFNGTRIYVSEGAGTFGPPMRLGTRSEITMIRLIPG